MALIKRVPVERLRPGMFVSRFDLSWFKHPFLTSRIGLLTDPKTASDLKRLGIKFVDIDLEKGLDVDDMPAAEEVQPAEPQEESPLFLLPPEPPPTDPSSTLRFAKRLYVQAVDCTKHVLGGAADGKPLEIEQARLLIARLIKSVKTNQSVLRLLSVLKDYDEYTYTHCLSVASMGVLFGNHMGLPDHQLELIGLSGLLHDVGKCLLPKEIVNKPGKLTDIEFDMMKRHPMLGWEYVKDQPDIPSHTVKGVLEHHERLDGSGYPHGLKGPSIAVVSRILSVLDVYDALTTDRVYRTRMSPHMALRTLYEMRGSGFPENILKNFIKCVGIYPPSTVVQLKNGYYAVVTGHDPLRPLNPYMTIFRGPNGQPVKPRRVATLRLGLESTSSGYDIARHVEPSEIPPPDLGTLL